MLRPSRALLLCALGALLAGCATPSGPGGASAAAAATPATAAAPATVGERLVRARFAAMTRVDVDALRPMLAGDLAYCHSDGRCEDRQQFLDAVAAGTTRYRAMNLVSVNSRAEGGTLITRGVVDLEGERNGAPLQARLAFLEVQARRDGAWRLVAWQSARLPAPAQ